jgi:glycosyltransferase involved in cell wall biosynthesis
MKIAYLLQMADVSAENGISKKILAQLTAWRAAGHDCRWFQLNPHFKVWSPLEKIPHHAPSRGNLWQRGFRSRKLAQRIDQWQPDLIYFRFAYHSPGLPVLFSKFPTVVEINSDDRREYPLTLGLFRTFYHLATRERLLRPVAGFVTVTDELRRTINHETDAALTIGNAIALETYSPLPVSPSDAPVRLIFMGTPRTPWHGLERIAELAQLFPNWHFDVIGDDANSWTASVSASPPKNLTLHGPLNSAQYLPILASADAALGTLGLYKKTMDEACPLKVREYLALGLPVIGACRDPDIPEGAEHYLRLPNSATPLAPHREEIAAFVEKWRGRRVSRAAVAHLDVSVKEAQRLTFMRRVADSWRAQRGLAPLPA